MTSTRTPRTTAPSPDPETRALPAVAYVIAGLATFALGVMVLVWPGKTLALVAALFGIQVIFSGLVQLSGAFRSPGPAGLRALLGILGLAAVVVGIILLLRPFTSLGVLVLLIAIGWFAQAVADVVAGTRARGTRRLGLWVLAVIAVAGAVVLLLWPALSLLVMVRLAGWTLVVLGLLEVFSAFSPRLDHD